MLDGLGGCGLQSVLAPKVENREGPAPTIYSICSVCAFKNYLRSEQRPQGNKTRRGKLDGRAGELECIETTGAASARAPVAAVGDEDDRGLGREAVPTSAERGSASAGALRRTLREEGGGAAETSRTRCHPQGADMVG